MWKAVLVPRKIAFDKNSFFLLNFDSNVHKSTFFSKLLFAKSSLEHSERIFKNTLGNLPWQIRPILAKNCGKNINSQFTPFSKITFQYARRKLTSETICFPSKLNLLCSEWDSSQLKSMFFLPTFSFLILFLTNC